MSHGQRFKQTHQLPDMTSIAGTNYSTYRLLPFKNNDCNLMQVSCWLLLIDWCAHALDSGASGMCSMDIQALCKMQVCNVVVSVIVNCVKGHLPSSYQ